GFKSTASDVEDLFIGRLDAADPCRFLAPGGSAAFSTRQETILVRNAAPVVLSVRGTRHGPVLSDALPETTVESGFVLALAASFLTEDDRTAETLWNLNRAGDWNEFRHALEN